MSGSFFILDFSVWYYTGAFRSLLSVGINFLWFIVHFFSMPLLLRTLFSPWKRITDTYSHTGIEDMLATFLMNIMTRVFGALVRLLVLVCGVICLLVGVVVILATAVLWVCTPLILIWAVVIGVSPFFT